MVDTSTLAGILAASRGGTTPNYLNPNARIPTTTAGEANRFRNVQQGTTGIPTPARPPAASNASSVADYFAGQVTAPTASNVAAASQYGNQPQRQSTTSTPTRSAIEQPVSVTEPGPMPMTGDAEAPAVEATPYNVYDDPFYQQALAGAQSQFNLARIDALANQQYQERPIQRELEDRPGVAEEQRRRLAGNYASRGMGGGRYGALTRAEAQMNAREIANRTGLREQIAELGRQFTSRFGAEGTDWLGTRAGMEAQQAAIQQAMQNRLGGLTTV
jgi:hypothetical protein